MPIVNCPACAWAHPSLIAHCLRCNDTRHVLVPEPFPPGAEPRELSVEPMPAVNAAFMQAAQAAKEDCMRITGIREVKRDPVGDALLQLERAMRLTGTIVTISTHAPSDMPLRMGCYDLHIERRERNPRVPFPRLCIELTLPSV